MKNRGFTLIELLVVLGISAVFVPAVLFAATFCIKTLNDIDKDVELQQQAQFIFSFMEDKIVDSAGVYSLKDKWGISKQNTKEKVSMDRIVFKKPKSYCTFSLTEYYEYDYCNLKYGEKPSEDGTIEVGNYIKNMEVEPIPADKTYLEADGILLRINFLLDGYRSSFEDSFIFRNSGRRF